MAVAENICPVCQTKNELDAMVCGNCGATLDDLFMAYRTKTTDMQAVTPEMIKEWSLKEGVIPEVPDSGIAVYINGESKPAYVGSQEEFVLGRKAGIVEEMLVDLAPFRGYSLGLSRRHAAIRRTEDSYEVMDLGSVNGTWLNNERLVPHTSYLMPSGSQLRLGHMRLFVLYRPIAERDEK